MTELTATLIIAVLSLCGSGFIIWLLCSAEPEQLPGKNLVIRKCKCHREYSHYEGDKDPGECHYCQIRK